MKAGRWAATAVMAGVVGVAASTVTGKGGLDDPPGRTPSEPAQGAQRDLLRRRRHGRLDRHRDARLLGRRRRPARRRPVPVHGAVADLLRGLDHAGQRADDVGDDDRRQHQPERHRLRTRRPSRTTSTTTATAPTWTLLELAKARGMKVGVVSTAQHHARDAGGDLRAHQPAQQRERHRPAGAADRRHLQPPARRRHRRADGRWPPVLRAQRVVDEEGGHGSPH